MLSDSELDKELDKLVQKMAEEFANCMGCSVQYARDAIEKVLEQQKRVPFPILMKAGEALNQYIESEKERVRNESRTR